VRKELDRLGQDIRSHLVLSGCADRRGRRRSWRNDGQHRRRNAERSDVHGGRRSKRQTRFKSNRFFSRCRHLFLHHGRRRVERSHRCCGGRRLSCGRALGSGREHLLLLRSGRSSGRVLNGSRVHEGHSLRGREHRRHIPDRVEREMGFSLVA